MYGAKGGTNHHYHTLSAPEESAAEAEKRAREDDESFILGVVVAEKRCGINRISNTTDCLQAVVSKIADEEVSGDIPWSTSSQYDY